MNEKESPPVTEETEDAQPQSTPDEVNRSPELEGDDAKQKVNGGLQAWLSVLGLFCIFVNSW